MTNKPKYDHAVKGVINRVVSQALMNLLRDRIGGTKYEGYCWVAEDDLEKVYEMLCNASTIHNFSEQDEQLVKRFDQEMVVPLADVRAFSVLRDQKDRELEVSGIIVLGVLWDGSVAYVIGGTTEEDPLTVKFVFSRLQEKNGVPDSIYADLMLLSKVPQQYRNTFLRFEIRDQKYEEKSVSRYDAAENIKSALGSPKPEVSHTRPQETELTCDGCGRAAEPKLALAKELQAHGIVGNNTMVKGLRLVPFNDKILKVCSECAKIFDSPAG